MNIGMNMEIKDNIFTSNKSAFREYLEAIQNKKDIKGKVKNKHPKNDGSELPTGGRAPKNDDSEVDKEEEFLDRITHDINYAIRYESPYDDEKKGFNAIVNYYRKNYF